MTKVKSAKLYDTIFVGGKNLGVDLNPSRHGGLQLYLGKVGDVLSLIVEWNKVQTWVPYIACAQVTPETVDYLKFDGVEASLPTEPPKPEIKKPGRPVKAQVSGPSGLAYD